ncbi:MAG: hypothetical protein LBS81_02325 [Endomicrobium sp.]|nr:hypothetical protein [Endomicrobium sp.]
MGYKRIKLLCPNGDSLDITGAGNTCVAVGSGIITLENVGLCSIGTSVVFYLMKASTVKDYKGCLHFLIML